MRLFDAFVSLAAAALVGAFVVFFLLPLLITIYHLIGG